MKRSLVIKFCNQTTYPFLTNVMWPLALALSASGERVTSNSFTYFHAERKVIFCGYQLFTPTLICLKNYVAGENLFVFHTKHVRTKFGASMLLDMYDTFSASNKLKYTRNTKNQS